MLTELQRRKLARSFYIIDANHDGFVERGDYEGVAQRLADYLGLPSGSAERQQHTAEYMAGWEYIQQAADSDGDDRVTLDEFLAANALIISQREVLETLALTTASNTMSWQDKDKDGRISHDEILGVTKVWAITHAEAEEAFRHLDRDGDGYISKDELLQATEEFFMSDDPNAPGNWLIGPY